MGSRSVLKARKLDVLEVTGECETGVKDDQGSSLMIWKNRPAVF